jgi:hypothetical protein
MKLLVQEIRAVGDRLNLVGAGDRRSAQICLCSVELAGSPLLDIK